MRNRILKMNVLDIPHDSATASEMVSKACARRVPRRVKGCYFSGGSILLTLERTPAGGPRPRYVFAQFPKENEDEIIAEINSRYAAGFDLVAGFRIGDTAWGLFEKNEDKEQPRA